MAHSFYYLHAQKSVHTQSQNPTPPHHFWKLNRPSSAIVSFLDQT